MVQFRPDGLPELLPITAAVIFIIQDGQVLITKIPRGWDIPGGHIEPGETPEQAVTREVYEETGGVVSEVQPIGYLHVTKQKHTPKNAQYPAESAIMVYAAASVDLQQDHHMHRFEATERTFIPVDELSDYHHNWSPMKAQALAHAVNSLGVLH